MIRNFTLLLPMAFYFFAGVASASPTTYYLNDHSTNGTFYTTAAGNDANDGLSDTTPMRTLTNLLATYTLEPGDIVYIDAGTYTGYTTVITDSGAEEDPIIFQGAPQMGATVFDRQDSGQDVIRIGGNNNDNSEGSHIYFRDLTVTGGSDGVHLLARGGIGVVFERAIVRDNAQWGFHDSESVNPNARNGNWIIRNSLIARNGLGGAFNRRNNSNFATWDNNIFYANSIHVETATLFQTGTSTFRNNVFLDGGQFLVNSRVRIAGDYNVFWGVGVRWGDNTRRSLAYVSELNMPNSTFADPGFVDPENLNFELLPDSILIDFGDPSMPVGDEPMPNGGRINAGLFGGTAEATTTPASPWLFAMSFNDGGGVSGTNNVLRWNARGFDSNDTVTVQYRYDLDATWHDIANSVPVTNRFVNWNVAGLPSTSAYWRVVSDADPAVASTNRQRLSINGGRVPFYVNNDETSGSVYTSVAGDDSNDGLTPETPVRSVTNLLTRYNFGGYETVYVDTGIYDDFTLTTPLRNVSGSPESGYFEIVGSTNYAAGGTVFDRANPTLRSADISAGYTRIKHIRFQGGSEIRVDNRREAGPYQFVGCHFAMEGDWVMNLESSNSILDSGFYGCVIEGPNGGIRSFSSQSPGYVLEGSVLWVDGVAMQFRGAFGASYSTTTHVSNSVIRAAQLLSDFTLGNSDYNILWSPSGGAPLLPNAYPNLAVMAEADPGWWNSTVLDPQFADPANGNFFPQSVTGRFDPATGSWTNDLVHSPVIDFGDPSLPVGDEPMPNGGRINAGAYGGTPWASLSRETPWLQVLSYNDGGVLNVDVNDRVRWIAGNMSSAATVRIELAAEPGADWQVAATGIDASLGYWDWTYTNQASTLNAQWRVVYEADPEIYSTVDSTFIFSNGPFIYYISSAATTNNNVYTTALGNDANLGTDPSTPKATLDSLFSAYTLGAGDIVYIDTGTYTLSSTLTVPAIQGGTAGLPVQFIGSTNYQAGGTVFNRTSTAANQSVFNVAAQGLLLRDIQFQGGGVGLRLDGAHNITLDRVRARDAGVAGLELVGATNVLVRRSVLYANRGDGIRLSGTTPSAQIKHSVLWANTNAGLRVSSGSATITNSAVSAIGPTAYAYHAATTNSIVGDYNNLQVADNGLVGFISDSGLNRDLATLGAWHALTGHETHSLSVDPLFVNPAAGNFYLRTAQPGGRFTQPGSSSTTQDAETSWLIAAGTPGADAGAEPAPNGGRVNIGLHGGTPEASMLPGGARLHAAHPRNGGRMAGTGTFHWVGYNLDPAETVSVEVSLDGGLSWSEITNGVLASTDRVHWDTTTVGNTPAAKWRVTADGAGVTDTAPGFFSVRNGGPLSLYVNNAGTDDTVYTAAPGNPLNWVASSNQPQSSLSRIFDYYDLEPGDTVYVDTGVYVEPTTPRLRRSQGGSEAAPVLIVGNPDRAAGGTVLVRDSAELGAYALQVDSAQRVTLRHLDLRSGYHGLRLDRAHHARVTDVRAVSNAVHGVFVREGEDVRFRSVLAAFNADRGMRGEGNPDIRWDHSVAWANTQGALSQAGGTLTVRNSALMASGEGAYLIDVTAPTTVNSDYNNMRALAGARLARVGTGIYGSLSRWRDDFNRDQWSTSQDPLFADPDALDFHPQSPAGRFNPASGNHDEGAETGDTVFSPLIDTGAPGDAFSEEPAPNGGRVNVGLHGNTAQASMSDTNGWFLTLSLNDGGSMRFTNTLYWAVGGAATNHTVTLQYSGDGGDNWVDIATDVPATDGAFEWDSMLFPSSGAARWRVVSDDDPSISAQTDSTFILNNGPLTFYVNTPSSPGDVYTSAPGSPLNNGTDPSTPKASIRDVIETYSLREGDMILVDTGEYDLSATIELFGVSGVATNRIVIQGSTNDVAGGTVLNRGGSGLAFDLDEATAVTLRNLTIREAGTGVRVRQSPDTLLEWVRVEDSTIGFDILAGSSNAELRHVVAWNNASRGISNAGPSTQITQAVLWGNPIGLWNQTGTATIQQAIIGASGAGAFAYHRQAGTINANFNNIVLADSAYAAREQASPFPIIHRSVSRWVRDYGQDPNSLTVDPGFVDAETGDFRLLSSEGRWQPDGTWTNDTMSSPLLAAGDPGSLAYTNEPAPNGGRVNIGLYGGSARASKVSDDPVLTAVSLNDGGRVEGTFELQWVARGSVTGDTVRIAFSPDAGVDWITLATNRPALSGAYIWDTTESDNALQGVWRVVSETDTNVVGQTETLFAVRNAPFAFYVNNGSAAPGDWVYTDAVGDDALTGLSKLTPKESIQAVLDAWDIEPGDTIYVDTGIYTLSSPVTVDQFNAGTLAAPVTLQGSTNVLAGGTVLNGAGVQAIDADGVAFRHLTVTNASVGVRFQRSRDGLAEWIRIEGGQTGFDVSQASTDTSLRHIVARGQTQHGIRNAQATGVTVRHAVLDGARWGVSLASGAVDIQQSVILVEGSAGRAYDRATGTLVSDFNAVMLQGGALAGQTGSGVNQVRYDTLSRWARDTGQDRHSLTGDPLFADRATGDYHLLSEAGRYVPGSGWTNDTATSWLIAAGNPAVDVGAEMVPNGGRINIGLYGGTEQASRAPATARLRTVRLNDGGRFEGTGELTWVAYGDATNHLVNIEYSPDGGVTWVIIAEDVQSTDGTVTWASDDPLYESAARGLWRVVSQVDSTTGTSDTWFALRNQPLSFYVNDSGTDNLVYTSAAGAAGNSGTAPESPRDRVQSIINDYTLEPGDTVYIDTGVYEIADEDRWVIGYFDRGAPGNEVWFQGSTNVAAGGTRLVQTGAGNMITVDDAVGVGFRHLWLEPTGTGIRFESDSDDGRVEWVQSVGGANGIQIAASRDVGVRHSAVRDATGSGILLSGLSPGLRVEHSVLWNNRYGLNINQQGLSAASLRNSVIGAFAANGAAYRFAINAGVTDSDYNNFMLENGAFLMERARGPVSGVPQNPQRFRTVSRWARATQQDLRSLSHDPLFVDADNGNFRLLSTAGYREPDGSWTNAVVTSPLISAGDPAVSAGAEPAPNGGRINIGQFGGTDQASRTPDDPALNVVSLNDGGRIEGTREIYWVPRGDATGMTVRVDYSANDGETWVELATNIAANLGFYVWDTEQSVSGPLARWRVTAHEDAAVSATNAAYFAVRNVPLAFYVNDNQVIDLAYTSVPGSPAQDGLTPATPLPRVQDVLARYDLEPGDTVYVDTGVYTAFDTILLDQFSAGAAGQPVTIQGSTNHLYATVLRRSGNGPVIDVADAPQVALRNLVLENTAQTGIGVRLDRSADSLLEWVVARDNRVGFNVVRSPNVLLQHILAWDNALDGLDVDRSNGTLVNHGILWDNRHGVNMRNGNVAVRNSVLGTSGDGRYAFRRVAGTIWSDYNNYWLTDDAYVLLDVNALGAGRDLRVLTLTDWREATGQDARSLTVDPLFANVGAGDFHLLSAGGRYTPGGVVSDLESSRLIDAGDPEAPFGNEPAPNGGRVNIGLYGNTAEASQTPPNGWLVLQALNDGGQAAGEIDLAWLAGGEAATNTLRIAYSIDDGVTWSDVATGIVAGTGNLVWNSTAVDSSPLARWKVVSETDSALRAESGRFVLRNSPIHYFVNNDSTDGNVYTSAPGAPAALGILSNAPKASIQGVLDAYSLYPGDVIYVDTGVYPGGTLYYPKPLNLTDLQKGEAGLPVTIRGSTNWAAGGTVLDAQADSSTAAVRLDTTEWITLRDMTVRNAGYGVWANEANDIHLQNVRLEEMAESGLRAVQSPGVDLENSIIWQGANVGIQSQQSTVRVKNSVIWDVPTAIHKLAGSVTRVTNSVLRAEGEGERIYLLDGSVNLQANYNNLVRVDGAYVAARAVGDIEEDVYGTATAWRNEFGQDLRSLSHDPLFVDPGAGRFHLLSETGYYDVNTGTFTAGDAHSPLIDAGDPLMEVGAEPSPNGAVINIGAYGGTDQASRSRTNRWLQAVTLNDGGVIAGTNTLYWLASNFAPEDRLRLSYSTDGGTTFNPIVEDLPAGTGKHEWDVSMLPPTAAGLWRVEWMDDASVSSHTEIAFSVRNEPLVLYVNDLDTNNTVFTSGPGLPTNPGTQEEPLDSLLSVFAQYPILAGDVIYVDAGEYVHDEMWVIGDLNRGTAEFPVRIIGSTNDLVGRTVITRTESMGPVARLAATEYIELHNLHFAHAERGIEIDRSRHIILNGLQVYGHSDDGALVRESDAVEFRRSAAWNNAGMGLRLEQNPVNVNWTQGVIWSNHAGGVESAAGTLMVTDSVLHAHGSDRSIYRRVGGDVQANFNVLWNTGGAQVAFNTQGSRVFEDLFEWQRVQQVDQFSVRTDPLFVAPELGHFILQSTAGRFDPATGGTVSDSVSSWAIDAGAFEGAFDMEPDPNGGRLNVGLYGNTDRASQTPTEPALRVVSFDDGGTVQGTQPLYWLAHGMASNATVRLEYSSDDGNTWSNIAAGVAVDAQGYTWDTTSFESSPAARWRVVYEADETVYSATESTFFMRNEPFTFYVNDGSMDDVVYTTAPGDPDNLGLSQDAPLDSLQAVFDQYALLPGDTVYVDTGHYLMDSPLSMTAKHTSDPAKPVRIIGSPHWNGTILDRQAAGAFGNTVVLSLTGVDHFEWQNFTLQHANRGLVLSQSAGNLFSNVVVRDGGVAAVDVLAGSVDNRFERTVLTRHQGVGLRQADVEGTTQFEHGIIWDNGSHGLSAQGGDFLVRHSVLQAVGAGRRIFNFEPGVTITSDFNNLYSADGAIFGVDIAGAPLRGLLQWNRARNVDWNSISEDPLFADAVADDYHPLSITGRFDPGLGGFTNDTVHSPLIDLGDPTAAVGDETSPNGDRVNIGLYGGTAEASQSRADPWLKVITGSAGGVVDGVFPLNWAYGNIDGTNTVTLEYSDDDGETWIPIADNLMVTNMTYWWESDLRDGNDNEIWPSSPVARWRLEVEADPDLNAETKSFFALRNVPFAYYVNDANTNDTVYTFGPGDDANIGFRPEAPKATLTSLLSDFRLEIGGDDQVFVDTGEYDEIFTLSVFNSGEPGNPVIIQGSTNWAAGGTVFARDGSGDSVIIAGDHVVLRNLRFQDGRHLHVRGQNVRIEQATFERGALLRLTDAINSLIADTEINDSALQITGGASNVIERADLHDGQVVVDGGQAHVLRNLLVSSGASDALRVADASELVVKNSTLYTSGSAYHQIGNTTAILRNNIVVADGPTAIGIDWGEGGLDSDYNLVHTSNGASIGRENERQWGRMLDWQAVTELDTHSFSADPLFVDAPGGDFRLQSPLSPAIDMGDPSVPVGDEPVPNGDRINMGRYGGTDEAALSRVEPWFEVLTANDGGFLRGEQTLRWVAGNMSGNVYIEYSVDGGTQWTNVATVGPLTESYTWDTTTVDDSFNARWRLRSEANPESVGEVDQSFTLRNNPAEFFVNDADTAGDVYSDAMGDSVNDGRSASAPLDSLQALLDQYDLTGGDVIYVDTGIYELTDPVRMIWSRGGHPDYGPVTIQGSTNLVAGGSVFVQNGSADGFDIKPAHVTLRDITVRGAERGFRFDGGEELVGERLFAFSNQTAIVAANVQDLTLRNLRLWDNAAGGVDLQNVQTALVEHVSYAADAPYGIRADSASSELTVQNSIFQVAANRVALDMPAPAFTALFLDYNVYDLAPDAVIWEEIDDLLPLQLTYGHDFRSALEPAGFVDGAVGNFLLRSEFGRYNLSGPPDWVDDIETAWAVDRANPDSSFDQETDPDGGRANIGAFGNTEWASRGRSALKLETRQFEEEVAIEEDAVWPLIWSVINSSESPVNVQFSGNGGANWVNVATDVNVYDEYILWTNTPFYNTRSGLWRVVAVGGEYGATNTGQIVTFNHETDLFLNQVQTVDGLTRVGFRGAWNEEYQVEYTADGFIWTNAPVGAGTDQDPLIGPEDRGGDFFYQDVESGTNRFRSYRVRWLPDE